MYSKPLNYTSYGLHPCSADLRVLLILTAPDICLKCMLGHRHCKESDGCFRGISSLTGNRHQWCSWGEGSSGLQLTTPPGKPYVWLLSLRSIILFPDTSSHVSLFKKFHDAWHQNYLGHSELSSGTFFPSRLPSHSWSPLLLEGQAMQMAPQHSVPSGGEFPSDVCAVWNRDPAHSPISSDSWL